ncbi:MAG: tetratricopeptide (TPR) repeat protein [Candidatus Azotimanducaceae bacterium]|jgi:tetratricopeptide (TPR) repeat protein
MNGWNSDATRYHNINAINSLRIGMRLTLLVSFLLINSSVAYGEIVQKSEISDLQKMVANLRSNGDFEAAVDVQTRIIDLLIRTKNAAPTSLNVHYYNMGILYYETDNLVAARDALEKSIDLTRSIYGPLHESTLTGLTSLGLVQLKGENLESALDSFSEAQHILHRSFGVRSIKQEALLDWMSKIHMDQDHFEAADRLQKLNYETYKSTFGMTDPRLVPAMLKLGQWLQNSAQYTYSINIYESALDIIEQKKLAPEVLQQALNGIARTHYLKGKCCALDYLAKAASAIKASTKHDNIDKRQAILQAADMSLLMTDNSMGQTLYKEAAQFGAPSSSQAEFETSHPLLLGISRIDRMILAYRPELENVYTASEKDAIQVESSVSAKLIGTPVLMCAEEISILNKNRDISNYVMDLDFEVTTNGRAENIRVSNSNAPISMNRLMKRIVHHYRFRPSLINGSPARTKMQLRQTFNSQAENSETVESNQFAVGKIATIHGCNLLATI